METNCSRAPFGNLTNLSNAVEAESALNSQSANNDKKQRKRERDRARYASMSQEQKNARNLRQREARKKKKECQNSMETKCSRAPFGDLTNYTNKGADSASNSQSTDNNAKNRKRERDRARYAAMSQEEKDAICLRKREVRQKKKGDRRVTYFWCYKYITCNLDGSRSQGSYKLVGPLHTSTCFVIFSHIFLLWYWSMYGCHNISTT